MEPPQSDTEPVLLYKPPSPPYPKEARNAGTTGEVVARILVRLDGSTEVVEVIEGLPHGCTAAAISNAALWTWEPATKNGRPVEAVGVIVVSIELFDLEMMGGRGTGGDRT